jgi:hypothetical protein
VFIWALFTVIWEIIENYFDIWHYIDDIKVWETATKKTTEDGKDTDLRIPLNWTVIRDNDISWWETERRSEIIYIIKIYSS